MLPRCAASGTPPVCPLDFPFTPLFMFFAFACAVLYVARSSKHYLFSNSSNSNSSSSNNSSSNSSSSSSNNNSSRLRQLQRGTLASSRRTRSRRCRAPSCRTRQCFRCARAKVLFVLPASFRFLVGRLAAVAVTEIVLRWHGCVSGVDFDVIVLLAPPRGEDACFPPAAVAVFCSGALVFSRRSCAPMDSPAAP